MVPLPSASTMSAAAISSGSHVLKVEGYSQTKRLVTTGQCIKSAKFKAAGHTWRIWYYPNGYSTRYAAAGCSSSLCLELASESTVDVHANFCFGLVRPGGKLAAEDTLTLGSGAAFFGRQNGRLWFSPDPARMEEAQEKKYLENDSFLLRCDITVMKKPVLRRHGLERLGLVSNCNDDKSKSKASEKQQSRLVVGVKEATDRLFGCFRV